MTPHEQPPPDSPTGRTSNPEALQRYRDDIEALDHRILDLVCQRLDLAKQIAELKTLTRTPLRNFEVEAEVHRRFAGDCETAGVDPTVGHDLALFLIQKSVEEQATFFDTAWDGKHLRCLVIGGKGGMGGWISRFLQSQGHELVVYDTDPAPSPLPTVDDLPAAALNADLIVVAVPMSECGGVLEQLAAVRASGLVAEMCSFKSHLAAQMERLRNRGLRLVSFHPLFGPQTPMLSGRSIVLCTEGRPADRAFLRRLFETTSARLVELDIREHDRRMGLVLGLAHMSNLVFARALMCSGIDAGSLLALAGVTYEKQIGTTREVCNESPALYFQIQAFNAMTPQAAGWLTQAVQDYLDVIQQGDAEGFSALMLESRAYLDTGDGHGVDT